MARRALQTLRMLHLAPHEPDPCPACAAPMATGAVECPECGLSLANVTPEGTVIFRIEPETPPAPETQQEPETSAEPEEPAADIELLVEAALSEFAELLTAELVEIVEARARRAGRRARRARRAHNASLRTYASRRSDATVVEPTR